MDPNEFNQKLREVACVKQIQSQVDDTNFNEIQIVAKTYPCEWCNESCTSYMNHWFEFDKKNYKPQLKSSCATCKKKVDVSTGQVGGKAFVARGIRQPRPGMKLGRPPKRKDWWNDDTGIILDGKDAGERRAELLDRLMALKQNK